MKVLNGGRVLRVRLIRELGSGDLVCWCYREVSIQTKNLIDL